MRNNKKVLGAVVLASVLAATGSAFTASNGGIPATAVGGYGATRSAVSRSATSRTTTR
jgi:hypothetical protein